MSAGKEVEPGRKLPRERQFFRRFGRQENLNKFPRPPALRSNSGVGYNRIVTIVEKGRGAQKPPAVEALPYIILSHIMHPLHSREIKESI